MAWSRILLPSLPKPRQSRPMVIAVRTNPDGWPRRSSPRAGHAKLRPTEMPSVPPSTNERRWTKVKVQWSSTMPPGGQTGFFRNVGDVPLIPPRTRSDAGAIISGSRTAAHDGLSSFMLAATSSSPVRRKTICSSCSQPPQPWWSTRFDHPFARWLGWIPCPILNLSIQPCSVQIRSHSRILLNGIRDS